MVDKTVARFGRLDVAVNNAATEGQVGPITDQTAESFAATFETNVMMLPLPWACIARTSCFMLKDPRREHWSRTSRQSFSAV